MILPKSSIREAKEHFSLSKREAQELNEEGTIGLGSISMLSIFHVLKSRQNPNAPSLEYKEDVMEVRLTYVGLDMSYGAPPRQTEVIDSIVVMSKQGKKRKQA